MTQLERLIDIMSRLRAPDGCPWDREQTHASLKPYLVEEAYELLDAIDEGDDAELREELGDVLLQVIFHAQVASEEARFDIEDVARTICEKLVRRHPHVFGDVEADTPAEVLKNWDAIKREERQEKGRDPSVLDGVPRHLPALQRAQRVQEKAARVGFDWSDIDEVAAKLREEVEEFIRESESGNAERIQDELGDILFSVVNVARFVGQAPEEALTRTTGKFIRRFRFVEQKLHEAGRTPKDASLEEMDALWETSKSELP